MKTITTLAASSLLIVLGASCASNRRGAEVASATPVQSFLYDGDFGVGDVYDPANPDAAYGGMTSSAQSMGGVGDTAYPSYEQLPTAGYAVQSAAPMAAPVASVASASQTHTVGKGDNLWRISQRYGTSVQALMSANNLSSDLIQAGAVLAIP